MKKIVCKVELIIADNCPSEIPISKETYANIIAEGIRWASSEEVIAIKPEIISSEGFSFK